LPLILLSTAWVAGIFLGGEFKLPLLLVLTGFVPLFFLFSLPPYRKHILLASIGLVAFFSAAGYSHASQHSVGQNDLRFYNDGGVVEIRGVVARDPDARDQNTRLHLEATEIKLGEAWRAVEGRALLLVPRYPAYRYGDVLTANGEPETPPHLDGFDYRGYLAHQGIYTTMLYPEIEIEARGEGFLPLEWVYSLRNGLARTMTQALPEPQASLAQGIVLGLRGNMPPPARTAFARSGTAHLLAISGLHLGIIVGIMLSIGVWLFGRRHYLYIWLALGVIWLYALLTGLHPPVVRGAIMASLFLSAELLGRQRSAMTALTLAAAVMVGISPYILGDAAFQLSFLAMAGLVFLSPTFRAWGRKAVRVTLGEAGALSSAANVASDSLSVTLAAVIAVWPVVAHYFGIISLVGPLATFLALPALPGIIIAGVLTGGLGLVWLPAAQVVGWLAWLLLSYLWLVVQGLAASPLSFVEAGSMAPAVIWAYYLGLASAIYLGRKRRFSLVPRAVARLPSGTGRSLGFLSRLPSKWVIPPLLLAAILVSAAAAALPDDRLHVSFLDVGQGSSILMQWTQHAPHLMV
jgi:competence protein ComEC